MNALLEKCNNLHHLKVNTSQVEHNKNKDEIFLSSHICKMSTLERRFFMCKRFCSLILVPILSIRLSINIYNDRQKIAYITFSKESL